MKTILVDGMHCIYDEEFNVNEELLGIVNSFDAAKILVVKGFRGKGRAALDGNGFEAFSLEEEGIGKDSPKYFERLLQKFGLKPDEVVFFDHKESSVEAAREVGIVSKYYVNNEGIKKFLKGMLG